MFDASFFWQPWSYNRQHSFFAVSILFWSMFFHIIIMIRSSCFKRTTESLEPYHASLPNDSLGGMMVKKVMPFLCTGVKCLFIIHQTKWKNILVLNVLLSGFTWQTQFISHNNHLSIYCHCNHTFCQNRYRSLQDLSKYTVQLDSILIFCCCSGTLKFTYD